MVTSIARGQFLMRDSLQAIIRDAPPDCWLALECGPKIRIVASGRDLQEVLAAAAAAGVGRPVLIRSPVREDTEKAAA